jgi:hypothetical protein
MALHRNTHQRPVSIASPLGGTQTIDLSPDRPYKITKIKYRLGNSTIDMQIQINGTAITWTNAGSITISIGTAGTTYEDTPSSSAQVNTGDKVDLVTTSLGAGVDALDVVLEIEYT